MGRSVMVDSDGETDEYRDENQGNETDKSSNRPRNFHNE